VFRKRNAGNSERGRGIDRALALSVKRLLISGVTAAALLTVGHTQGSASETLQLEVTPTFSTAPARVVVRALVEHSADNRALEIVADSNDFYRRSVVDLDGASAPKVNELQLIDIPGGEYQVTATLYDAHGVRTSARRSIVVMSQSGR
jgi:hypothetical protein